MNTKRKHGAFRREERGRRLSFESFEQDDFPTPPWATRVFMDQFLVPRGLMRRSVWEPAAGRGFMASSLVERFPLVLATDAFDYGNGIGVHDFIRDEPPVRPEWIITNPPFHRKVLIPFIQRALDTATFGVAMFVRGAALHGKFRYDKIYKDNPPSYVLPYVNRVRIVKGMCDSESKLSTHTDYVWVVWLKDFTGPTQVQWLTGNVAQHLREGDDTINPSMLGLVWSFYDTDDNRFRRVSVPDTVNSRGDAGSSEVSPDEENS